MMLAKLYKVVHIVRRAILEEICQVCFHVCLVNRVVFKIWIIFLFVLFIEVVEHICIIEISHRRQILPVTKYNT